MAVEQRGHQYRSQRVDRASMTYVYSWRGRTRLGTMAPVPVYIPVRPVDNYSWISSGEGVADSAELAGGFPGALQYLHMFICKLQTTE